MIFLFTDIANKLKKNRKLFFFVAFSLLSLSSYAQKSCIEKLEEAEKYYESGQIDLVAPLLQDCLIKGFTKEEKVRAYRLLTLYNLYYNQDAEARNNFLELLKVDKEYKLKEIDPSEFSDLYSKFRTSPVIIAGAKFGIGLTGIYNIDYYNDINSVESVPFYTASSTFSYGVSVEVPVYKQFSLSCELYYSSFSYTLNDTILSYSVIQLDENVSQIDMPLTIQWNISKGDFVPYLKAGSSLNYLLSSNTSVYRQDEESGLYRRSEMNFNLTDSRNRFNYSITAGAGFRWKNFIGPGYVTCELRYIRYLNDYLDSENRASNPEMVYSGLITDNTFRVQNVQFFIGYKLPFYKPKYKVKH